jgi:hypothetical protein
LWKLWRGASASRLSGSRAPGRSAASGRGPTQAVVGSRGVDAGRVPDCDRLSRPCRGWAAFVGAVTCTDSTVAVDGGGCTPADTGVWGSLPEPLGVLNDLVEVPGTGDLLDAGRLPATDREAGDRPLAELPVAGGPVPLASGWPEPSAPATDPRLSCNRPRAAVPATRGGSSTTLTEDTLWAGSTTACRCRAAKGSLAKYLNAMEGRQGR